jgi:hypothetical protein
MKIFKNLDINNLENEDWKINYDFPDYQVSNLGRVKSFKRYKNGKILKQYENNEGYLTVGLLNNGLQKTKQVHILIYETFYNDKLKLNECVHHKDENKENNYYENLEKMFKFDHNSFHKKGSCHSEKTKNKISKTLTGRYCGKNNPMYNVHKFGNKSPNHKLIEQDVIQIKLLLKEGKLTQQEIAYIFEVSISMISAIKKEKNWQYIKI